MNGMKKAYLFSFIVHTAVLVVIIIFSTGRNSAARLSLDLGPTVTVSMWDRLPGAMPDFKMPSTSFTDGGFTPEPVKLSKITKKEKIAKPKADNKKKTNKPAEKTLADKQAGDEKKAENDGANNEPGIGWSAAEAGASGDGQIAGPLAEYYLSYPANYAIAKIKGNWSNPVTSNTTLTCVIYFQITKFGDIKGVAVKQSSGNRYFDQYAELAVKATNKLPALPMNFPDDAVLEIDLTFIGGK